MTLVLAGCSSGTTRTTSPNAGKARIPAICKKFPSTEEQQKCAGRWQVAQEECKREETATREAGDKRPSKKFSMSKCITKKMNLAAAAQKPTRPATSPSGEAPSTAPRATAPRVAPPAR